MQRLSRKRRRSGEKLHDDVESVTDFSHPGDGIYSEGGCGAAVPFITRLGWVIFGDCHDLLCGKITSENQRKSVQMLCEISKALFKRDMVLRSE